MTIVTSGNEGGFYRQIEEEGIKVKCIESCNASR